ncbi:Dual oxidase maturation factor 1 [Orchesella cincta]|uniref:Dual oxidase maturation factor 1 n=1 Tax=Orchesella cincta TaxID=48709 RepID=A0A1D2NEH2_ORCCI|nr:Dual oxidase maturation factor 1 [Orchesella cincta]
MGGFGFNFGRPEEGYPTRYPDKYSPAHTDVLTAGFITVFSILAIASFAIIPAYGSFKRKLFLFVRIVCSIAIGGVILVGNYGHNWEKGEVSMSAPYKPGLPDEVQGKLALHIELRGINITLKGGPAKHDAKHKESSHIDVSPLAKETIDYNEHFSWEWAQGRFGFGKYAGRFSREFRAAVIRGVPLPILQTAEYFTFDGEGIRFGRHYRLAGWYTHLILWFAFGTWLITNILFCMVIRTAAFFLFITGCLQISAVAVWTFVRNPIELQIPFQSADGFKDIHLKTHYGLDYYLVFANGLFCVILAGIITLMDTLMPDETYQYFGIDPLTIYDELLLSQEEIREENKRRSILHGKNSSDIEMQSAFINPNPSGGTEDGEDATGRQTFLKRRSNLAGAIVRSSFRHIKPRIPRRSKGVSGVSQSPYPEGEARKPLLRSRESSDDEGGEKSNDPQGSWPIPSSSSSPTRSQSPSHKGLPPPIPIKKGPPPLPPVQRRHQ